MKYKILLASLLPFVSFGMEAESKISEAKITQKAPTYEQRCWIKELYASIQNHAAASIDKNSIYSQETCLSNIKELIAKLKAQDALGYIDKDTDYPLNCACYYGYEKVAQIFINTGAPINLDNSNLDTLLHKAVYHDNGEFIIKLLLDKGANVNAQGDSKHIPLHYASSAAIVTLLVQAGSHLESTNDRHRTPLLDLVDKMSYIKDPTKHQILRQNLIEAVGALLTYGVNIHAQDENRKTAYYYLNELNLDPEQLIKQAQEKQAQRICPQLNLLTHH